FRIICSYIDQGIAISPFPYENTGLLNALRHLEERSLVSFFKSSKARELLRNSCTITELLEILVGKNQEAYYEQYVYDQQFGHQGWSGMVATLEDKPESLLYPKNISLKDMITLELLLEIDELTSRLGEEWKPLGSSRTEPPINMFADEPPTELQEVIKIWQDAFEWSYYDTVLSGIILSASPSTKVTAVKSFQTIFCIDEREYSLRTYVEMLDRNCETFGAPGFFGVAFYFHPANAKFYDKLCPAPVTPTHLIKEIPTHSPHAHEQELMYIKHSHELVRGWFFSYVLGIPALGKLVANLINPTMSPAIADSFSHMDPSAELSIVYTGGRDNVKGLQIGFTAKEMADRVEKMLQCIGLTKNFSPLVYVIGHGSSSANNPHHGAHDCGACSGRPGLVNARVFAFMANYQPVRELLKQRGLSIPDSTQFIGSMHDTASDEIRFYDEGALTEKNSQLHSKNKQLFEHALDLDAKERSRRFMSINTKQRIKKIRSEIKKRSVSYYEPRPELGHGTNALCVVGRRNLTKHLFLDRRAFLNSYDYTTDLEGTLLLDVLRPLGIVCGGINLEYFFSRMDNYKLGAGTKLPHNVMGLVGVANSSDGDLRSGLPLQMIEVHDPVRLLMIVEHYPEVVKKVVQSDPALYEWFANEWIHLVVLDPTKNTSYVFKDGEFTLYNPLTKKIPTVHDLPSLFETSPKMKTNDILDATQENLPVHIITKR
ncbi:MAG: putative inorganic carbon transporter subunit DabA, partial [Patescibacteria group bacterium]